MTGQDIPEEENARPILTSFRDQMRTLSRSAAVLFFFLLVPVIPLLYLPVAAIIGPVQSANVEASHILFALPVVSMASASVVCGSIIQGRRTEVQTASLVGRFLAGLTIPMAVVCGAYGVAFAISAMTCPMAYTGLFLASLGVALAGTFFFCAFSFMMGIRFGDGMLSFFLLAIAMPAVCLLIFWAVPGLAPAIGCLPVFSADLALNILGGAGLSLDGLMSVAIEGRLGSFVAGADSVIMSALSAALGLACVAAGCRWARRRDA